MTDQYFFWVSMTYEKLLELKKTREQQAFIILFIFSFINLLVVNNFFVFKM